MARLKAGDWLILVGAVGFIGVGLTCIGWAVGANVEAVANRQTFETSGAAQRAEQAVSAPTPIWVQRSAAASAPPIDAPALFSSGTSDAAPTSTDATATAPVPAVHSVPQSISPWSNVSPMDAGFRFFEPPQPGSHSEVWVRVTSPGPRPGAFVLAIPLAWFDGHRIEGTRPPAERTTDIHGERRLFFSNLQPGIWTVALDIVSTAEGVEPPTVRVEQFADGQLAGEAHPQTVAPPPNPGPVSALHIARIGLDTAVVPTTWEPPPFIVGELKGSAAVTQGNTVLVGHVSGAAGAVFNKLDDLTPGDTIVAVSRGREYSFVVSDKQTLPADDSQPAAPDDHPRLTLMTCTGTWDPLAHNYSDRLWVTAEPPGAAAATIAANALRPPTPTAIPADSEPASLVAAAGLGADRAAFGAALGPPLGETPGKLVVYRQGSTEYHVAFTADLARAELIEIVPLAPNASLTIPTAVVRSRSAFPTDAMPLMAGPDESGDLVVERFTSPALGALVSASDRGGNSGDFLAEYVRDAHAGVTHVVVAIGSDQDAARRDAER